MGNGKYIHANGSSFDTRINSLFVGDPDYRVDLGTPSSIYTWGTAFPEYPDQLIVRQFRAERIGTDEYGFYGKVDGDTPNRGILYPEGKGAGRPQITIEDPEYMLYEDSKSTNTRIPVYRYTKPGTYYPVIEWINDQGWRPDGRAIIGEGILEEPIVVRPITDRDILGQMREHLREQNIRDYLIFRIGINLGLPLNDLLRLRLEEIVGKKNLLSVIIGFIFVNLFKRRLLFLLEAKKRGGFLHLVEINRFRDIIYIKL